ncbi:hypothetical protein [Proteiniclasticum sp. QWL-01]|uniref:hypothetical protein n=1 Tax=Proteiniclasticum sp. QWL-01 TaxID=3036945 RepID=UPI00240F3D37|nr:hypothetical protein [Proteiniclasticum sp. QWL-01]WFF72656.1 hypothetical protein P6M73_15510 [Proteiniclasticum sp. QWL-01]
MTEKQFLRAALDHYFTTGNRFYHDKGKAILVDLETITKYKALPDEPTDYAATVICPE